MQTHDWSDYDRKVVNRAAGLGCCMLLATFAAGVVSGVLAIWLYQEFGFRS